MIESDNDFLENPIRDFSQDESITRFLYYFEGLVFCHYLRTNTVSVRRIHHLDWIDLESSMGKKTAKVILEKLKLEVVK